MSVLVSKHYATKTVRGSIDVAEEVCNFSQKYQESPKIKAYLGLQDDFTHVFHSHHKSLDSPLSRNIAAQEANTLDSPLVRKSHDHLLKARKESITYYEELSKPEEKRKVKQKWSLQKQLAPLLKLQDTKRKIVLFQKKLAQRKVALVPLKNSQFFKVKISRSQGEDQIFEERNKRRKQQLNNNRESPRSVSENVSNLIVKREEGKRRKKVVEGLLPQILLRRKGEVLEAETIMKLSSHRVVNTLEPQSGRGVADRLTQINNNHMLQRLTTNKLARIRREAGAVSERVFEKVLERESKRRGLNKDIILHLEQTKPPQGVLSGVGKSRFLSKSGRSMDSYI